MRVFIKPFFVLMIGITTVICGQNLHANAPWELDVDLQEEEDRDLQEEQDDDLQFEEDENLQQEREMDSW